MEGTGEARAIRGRHVGRDREIEPRVPWRDRLGMLVLAALGVQAFLYFAEYWFFSTSRRSPFLFALLSVAVFWNPLRNLYNWWIYLWASHPLDLAPARPHPEVGDRVADVFTTAMPGEPYAMFETTLEAIAKLERLGRAYLLDGGFDPRLGELCARLGIEHVDCRGVSGAKAGKVNHCLRERSRAEFVLVIDPDHIPKADFLTRVLPWFDDPDTGFVQVVQAYYNLRENWVAWGAAEQTFGFYGTTQMGLNGLGIPTAIGANCTFRREALDSIGGHAEHLAEDALTSMRIHSEGWHSVYLPWRGSEGLVPVDLGTFWKQQLKWATGMSYLMFTEVPRLFRKFSPVARLHYAAASTYYLGGVAQMLNLFLPIVCLFFQVYAIEVPLLGFLVHLAPYVAISTVMHMAAQRWYTHREEKGIPWRSMLLEKATWHINLMGFVFGAIGRKVPYLPTPKEGSEKPIPWLVAPHWVVIVLSLLAVAWVPLTYHRVDDGTWLMVVFALMNAAMLAPAAWLGIRGWFRSPSTGEVAP